MHESYDTDRFGAGGALVVLLVLWSLITVAGDFVGAWNVARQIRARGYPSAEGQIIRSDLKVHWSDGSPTYGMDLQFAYTVKGVVYTGNRYRYRSDTGKKELIQKLLAPLKPGQAVTVRYNPSDPSDAVLQPGVDGQDLFVFTMMSPFNAAMLAGWIIHFRLRRTGSILETRFFDDGVVARAAVDAWLPELAATIVAGVVGFALGVLVGIPTGADMSISVAAATAITVVIAAALAWWRTIAARTAGSRDIILDRGAQTLTLPKLKGRPEPMTVPLQVVTGFDLSDAKQDQDHKKCTVRAVLRAPDGHSIEKVTDPTDSKSAQRLLDWLREGIRC
jgi:hypothetical protein